VPGGCRIAWGGSRKFALAAKDARSFTLTGAGFRDIFGGTVVAAIREVRECPCHSRRNTVEPIFCITNFCSQGKILMTRILCRFRVGNSLLGCALLSLCLASAVSSAQDAPAVTLTQMSSDPFKVGPGQHATEVEPHMLANGSTLVASFQTGRIVNGGGTAIGWATSTDGGSTWTHGFLPGLTSGNGGGPYSAASDPAVAFDAKHDVWMIASLPIGSSATPAVVVSRSTDGGLTWDNPVNVGGAVASSDKNWIACDSTATSPFYGNCYVEWDNPNTGDGILMSTSTDGGLTWGPAKATANHAAGIGGQPLVQPSGRVVVPIETGGISAYISTNGGATWSAPKPVARIQAHQDAGGIRSGPLPSAAVDGAGNVWVVWEDCRFRTSCSTNDLVYDQYGGSLYSRYRRRSSNLRRDRACGGYVLLLSKEQLLDNDLPPGRGLYFFAQWRDQLERVCESSPLDAAGVAAQFAERPHGW
jgi:hypothetical protein